MASIKPSPPGVPVRAGCLGGPPIDPTLVRCSNYPLRNFVMEAWGLAAWEYRGPDWMLDAMFDIEGTAREQYLQMLGAVRTAVPPNVSSSARAGGWIRTRPR